MDDGIDGLDEAQLLQRLLAHVARDDGSTPSTATVEDLYDISMRLGSRAAKATPLLLRALANPTAHPSESSAYALGYACAADAAAVIPLLSDANPVVRQRACHVLGLIGVDAAPWGRELVRLLTDPDREARRKAAWALGLVRFLASSSIDGLAVMASSDSAPERASALHALRNLAEAAGGRDFLRMHRPLVSEALSDPDADVRRWALELLPATGYSIGEAAASLQDLSFDCNDEVASAALSNIKEGAAAYAPFVDAARIAPLATGSRSVARLACELLGVLGQSPSQVTASLDDALRHEEPSVVLAAAAAMHALALPLGSAVAAVRRVFGDVPESACDFAATVGPAARGLLTDLMDAAKDVDDWDLQWAVMDALASVAPKEPAVVDRLLQALEHDSPIVKSAAMRGLAKSGAAAVPALVALVADQGAPAAWAADALGHMGDASLPALQALEAAASSGDDALATWATVGAALLSGDARWVEPLLAIASSIDAYPYVQERVADALASLGPAAAAAVPLLGRLAVESDDEACRTSALRAMEAIAGRLH